MAEIGIKLYRVASCQERGSRASEMDSQKKPQPPPSVCSRSKDQSATSKSRSRSSTPTTPIATIGARNSGPVQSPKASNIVSSPRGATSSSASKPTHDEPATDEDDESRRSSYPPRHEWFRLSEETLVGLEKQVNEAAKKNARHQKRCTMMRDSIVGKGESMTTLQGTFATLTRALNELESFSSAELDLDLLEEMYLSIPPEDRSVLGNAE